MFRSVPGNVRFPDLEAEVIRFWNDQRIYEKSLEQRAGSPRFVFFEGPPTANGMPHPGHCLTRAIKDVFPRYRTMRGYLCERKGGWDTHGLPVEVEVCKELGIHSKEEIEQYGVEPFIHKCQASVWRYMQEWERLTERLGFWIHLDEAYVTYHQSYVESVWWALANFHRRGLLYQGHKIVWWWAQGGTALSSGEVGQGYREVADPSVYVRFPLVDEQGKECGQSLLVWTTTPWTLPSNQFAAVKEDLEYSVVADPESEDKLILASALVETVAKKVKRELTVESTLPGSELIGRLYRPPFDYYYSDSGADEGELAKGGKQRVAWRVIAADFVTTDSGSGVVHQAPAFGEVDYDVLLAEQRRFKENQGPPMICAVGPDGKFTDVAGEYAGRWVKEADRDISRELRGRGLLYHQEQYLHEYPFCWRAPEDPLIQYPRESWFIHTRQFRDRMLANNHEIHWLPEHIRDGRFGNFLESNVDWALSRERYWGTPLPIWKCEETGYADAISSYDELLAKPGVTGTEVWDAAKAANPELPDDLKVHKPYIDAVTYDSPKASGKRMRRVPEVIDCWFDSGSMPFAQWGYPQTGREQFAEQFPADFISEALDQTRGWFYSLHAISTMLFGDVGSTDEDRPLTEWPHPFKNCIVLGLMLGEDGKKMSKSLRNYREPNEIFDNYGADALRWYFFANQAPWTPIRYNESAIKESIPEFLLRLWNCYSFFGKNASAQQGGFNPADELSGELGDLTFDVLSAARSCRPVADRSELDRWLLSELNRTLEIVIERMDAYDNFAACEAITRFVDGLSNWYIRRSRDLFWDSKPSPQKSDSYWTLYECLLTTAKMIAPFVPFVAERLWQDLAREPFREHVRESVHLCDYPEPQTAAIDQELSARMDVVRQITSLGRAARAEAKLKVRQPLAKVEVVLADAAHQPWLESHDGLVADELNVKQVEYAPRADEYVDYVVLPDLKKLGPRLGKQLPKLKAALNDANPADLMNELESKGQVSFTLGDGPVELTREDLLVRLQAKEGWAAAHGSAAVVVLSTELTPELTREGHARDLIRNIQETRRELDCEYEEKIKLVLVTDSDEVRTALRENEERIKSETQAVEFVVCAPGEEVEHVAGVPEDRLQRGTLTVGDVSLEFIVIRQ